MIQKRDIPTGKVLLAEYSDLNDSNKSIRITLDVATHNGREYSLVEVQPGFESAGSCARWTNGGYGVLFELDGSRHGRNFKTIEEARELFNKWTGREVA